MDNTRQATLSLWLLEARYRESVYPCAPGYITPFYSVFAIGSKAVASMTGYSVRVPQAIQ